MSLLSKMRRLHARLSEIAVTDDDRDNIKTAVGEVSKAVKALEVDPSNIGAALHWCEQAKPYIKLTGSYPVIGQQESPNQTIHHAQKLLAEILSTE